jgi:hypothetical protein
VDEHLEAEPDGGRVDDGPVAADRPAAFQFAQPPVAGRDAERDPLGELGDSEAARRLQLGKYLPVSHVHEQYYCSLLQIAE